MTAVIEAASAGVRDMADGSLRITFEFEPRHAPAAYALFGSRGTAVAVAALKPSKAEKPEPKRGLLSQWAAMRCEEPEFQRWILRIYDKKLGGRGDGWGDLDAESVSSMKPSGVARHAILVLCDINSRAELDSNERAAAEFHRLIRAQWAEHCKQTEAA